MNLVQKSVKWAGGQMALARKFNEAGYPNVKQQHVWKWLRLRNFPPAWATAAERVTGGLVTADEVLKAIKQNRPRRAA